MDDESEDNDDAAAHPSLSLTLAVSTLQCHCATCFGSDKEAFLRLWTSGEALQCHSVARDGDGNILVPRDARTALRSEGAADDYGPANSWIERSDRAEREGWHHTDSVFKESGLSEAEARRAFPFNTFLRVSEHAQDALAPIMQRAAARRGLGNDFPGTHLCDPYDTYGHGAQGLYGCNHPACFGLRLNRCVCEFCFCGGYMGKGECACGAWVRALLLSRVGEILLPRTNAVRHMLLHMNALCNSRRAELIAPDTESATKHDALGVAIRIIDTDANLGRLLLSFIVAPAPSPPLPQPRAPARIVVRQVHLSNPHVHSPVAQLHTVFPSPVARRHPVTRASEIEWYH